MMSLAYQSAGGIDSDGRRRSISGGVFYFDTIPFSFAHAVSVLPLRLSDTRNGTEACLSALVPLFPLVAAFHGVADDDGVPIDGV